MEIFNQKVAVVKTNEACYSQKEPFHPDTAYPEYPFKNFLSNETNHAYSGVRNLFFQLGYDLENWETPQWNPLGFLIKPGMNIVIKPNFVLSKHPEGKDLFSIITHPSILRAVVDYCLIALKGRGEIVIADAPQYNCNFEELMINTALPVVKDFINNNSSVKLEIIDLRKYWSKTFHFPSGRRSLPGDPLGDRLVNLSKYSLFNNYQNREKLYGAVYHRQETILHHTGKRQEYEVSETILQADVLISVPKMKVHKKVGVTLNLKGLVGICTNKNLLVHYTLGSPEENGDQFPPNLLTKKEKIIIKFERWMYDHFLARRTLFHEMIHRFIYGFFYKKIFANVGFDIPKEKRLLDAGNWYGNDSAWRMVVDLARIIYFEDKNENKFDYNRPRKIFSIVDGIVAGENKGPLSPDPKLAGIIIGGENILAVDLVATRLMGFDPLRMKQYDLLLKATENFGPKKLSDIEIMSNDSTLKNIFIDPANKFFNFKPYPGWVGHIEI